MLTRTRPKPGEDELNLNLSLDSDSCHPHAYQLRAVRTPLRFDRNFAHALGTLLGRWIGRLFAAVHPCDQGVHGQHDKEINGRGNQDERNARIDEIADREFSPAYVELQAGIVRLADNGGDQRCNESLAEPGDNASKRAPITTPTAMSTTFPRRMNFLNPSSIMRPL
jgi:hypothetical protein